MGKFINLLIRKNDCVHYVNKIFPLENPHDGFTLEIFLI